MEPAELNRFLATVRKTRFIDYLDPIGMSAEEALEQRLKWARRNADVSAYAEESDFLITHAAALRDHIASEAAHPEEWIDAVEAGMDAPPPTWGGAARVTQMSENEDHDAPTVHVGQLTGLDFMDDFHQDDLPTVHVDDLGADAEDAPTVVGKSSDFNLDREPVDTPLPPDDEDAEDPTVFGVSPGLIPESSEDEESEDPTVFVGRERIEDLLGEHVSDDPTVAGKFVDIDDEDPENERTSITRLDDLAPADGTSRPASDLGARLAEVRARRAEKTPEDDHTVYAAEPMGSPFHSPTIVPERASSPHHGHTIIPTDEVSEAERDGPVTPPIPGTSSDFEPDAADAEPTARMKRPDAFPPIERVTNDASQATPVPPPPADPQPSLNTPAPAAVRAAPPPKPPIGTPLPTADQSTGGSGGMLLGIALIAVLGAVVCGVLAWQGGFLSSDAPDEPIVVTPTPQPETEQRDTAPPSVATRPAPVAPVPVAPVPVEPIPVAAVPDPAPAAPVTPAPAPVPVVAPPPRPQPAPVTPAPSPAPSARPAPPPRPTAAPQPVAVSFRTQTPAALSSAAPTDNVVGTWRGDIGSDTSVLLRIRSQDDGNVSAKIETYDGRSWSEGIISGTYDPASGAVSLSGDGMSLTGRVNGATTVGTLNFSGRRAGYALRKL